MQHPHVATVVRFVMEPGQSMSMLVDCSSDDTLLDLMRRSEHMETRFLYYEQIADGMAYLHERHFIHGCLQAKFIYVTPNGRVSSKLYLWSRFAVLFVIFRVTNTEC